MVRNHLLLLHRLLLNQDASEIPVTKQTASGSGNGGDSNFDSNMVIILAALLSALICALGLNSIVRCALRCRRRFSSDDLAVQLAASSTGLKKDVLQQIPVVIYKSEIIIPATECPICLAEFSQGEKIRILPPCNHRFHLKCIDIWLASHSSCPTCRQLLFQQSTATADAAE
ncbi:hypothetical protein M9H77_01042 [Catharanthus roseus]|uniref:Uncharacterized protein n=1 Tax=Catharanthus roseus TaxID=4058 RepID=A0ACC0C4K3_CATRO|nr:hypothetical protein M9H77_01042 [Catharanthus roseus]